MSSNLVKILFLLLATSYYVSCARLQNYNARRKGTRARTMMLDGIDWTTLGLSTDDPKFETFEVTALGMQAELASNQEFGIVVADNLGRDKSVAEEGTVLANLIEDFIEEQGIQLE